MLSTATIFLYYQLKHNTYAKFLHLDINKENGSSNCIRQGWPKNHSQNAISCTWFGESPVSTWGYFWINFHRTELSVLIRWTHAMFLVCSLKSTVKEAIASLPLPGPRLTTLRSLCWASYGALSWILKGHVQVCLKNSSCKNSAVLCLLKPTYTCLLKPTVQEFSACWSQLYKNTGDYMKWPEAQTFQLTDAITQQTQVFILTLSKTRKHLSAPHNEATNFSSFSSLLKWSTHSLTKKQGIYIVTEC